MRTDYKESFVMGKPTQAAEGEESPRGSRPERRSVYATLRAARCRTVLSTLEREGSMDEATLAVAVLAAERDVSVTAVSDDDVERARNELYHVHLPKLEATGFVSWADGTVQTRLDECHEVVPGARAFVEADRSTAAEFLHQLSVAERRAVLEVLSTADGPMETTALAAAIGALTDGQFDEHGYDTLCLALHHVHLPMLDKTGLVRYDHEDRAVELATLVPRADEAA